MLIKFINIIKIKTEKTENKIKILNISVSVRELLNNLILLLFKYQNINDKWKNQIAELIDYINMINEDNVVINKDLEMIYKVLNINYTFIKKDNELIYNVYY